MALYRHAWPTDPWEAFPKPKIGVCIRTGLPPECILRGVKPAVVASGRADRESLIVSAAREWYLPS